MLTEENIREVYGIESKVSDSFMGIPQVIPLITGINRIKGSQISRKLAEKYA